MKNPIQAIIFLFALLQFPFVASAYETKDSVRVYFRQGKTDIDTGRHENAGASIGRMTWRFLTDGPDSTFRINRILVVGGASPEGSIALNRWLSEQRAEKLYDRICRYYPLPDSLKTSVFLGRDWTGLYRLVQNDENVPYRDEALKTLDAVVSAADDAGEASGFNRLKQLRGGVPYNYMYRNLFPELRSAVLYVWYDRMPVAGVCDTQKMKGLDSFESEKAYAPFAALRGSVPDMLYDAPTPWQDAAGRSGGTSHSGMSATPPRTLWGGVKSNMLYDALLVPNIGIELYLGRNWSVACNWMYSWWKNDRVHYYWRVYGGDAEVRYWFGKQARKQPLTGHHVGLYGQMVTYDFELGGEGFLADRWTYGCGLSYGYSLPVARRLNVDFTAGIGYLSGTYKRYLPIDTHYVWQSTHRRRSILPTKLEVSLVWLISVEKSAARKGGRR